jgi:putative endonuclease
MDPMLFRRTNARPALGRAGEAAVAHWYQQRGATILARNYKTIHGELDLVVAARGCLVGVEVKTRTDRGGRKEFPHGRPSEAVGAARLRRLCTTLELYASTQRFSGNLQIDVAEVVADIHGAVQEIRVLENVTR